MSSFFFQKHFPRTSFLMIQMTEVQLSNHFLCLYYMLWNTSRKMFQKTCWEMSLFTIWTRNSYKREGKGAPFVGLWSQKTKQNKTRHKNKAAVEARSCEQVTYTSDFLRGYEVVNPHNSISSAWSKFFPATLGSSLCDSDLLLEFRS